MECCPDNQYIVLRGVTGATGPIGPSGTDGVVGLVGPVGPTGPYSDRGKVGFISYNLGLTGGAISLTPTQRWNTTYNDGNFGILPNPNTYTAPISGIYLVQIKATLRVIVTTGSLIFGISLLTIPLTVTTNSVYRNNGGLTNGSPQTVTLILNEQVFLNAGQLLYSGFSRTPGTSSDAILSVEYSTFSVIKL